MLWYGVLGSCEMQRRHDAKVADIKCHCWWQKAKRALQEIRMAETKKDALAAFDAFVEAWGVKYDKAVECLTKDREALLAFSDFPAEHWKHLRTTNVIESSFATIRHRTVHLLPHVLQKAALPHQLPPTEWRAASNFAPNSCSSPASMSLTAQNSRP